MNEEESTLFRPFGPSIFKVRIPEKIIQELNDYVDKIIKDKEKSISLDHGKNLAGNVTQEFKLEKEFMKEIQWAEFLGNNVATWIAQTLKKKITKFNIRSSWVVRQFENEYNPVHWHDGHISGVGYLKVPENLGDTTKNKKDQSNGLIELLHGSKMFLSDSHFKIKPIVGSFYFFPNYLMHTVYPFKNSKEERRSISFNATIDDEIYDVYSL